MFRHSKTRSIEWKKITIIINNYYKFVLATLYYICLVLWILYIIINNYKQILHVRNITDSNIIVSCNNNEIILYKNFYYDLLNISIISHMILIGKCVYIAYFTSAFLIFKYMDDSIVLNKISTNVYILIVLNILMYALSLSCIITLLSMIDINVAICDNNIGYFTIINISTHALSIIQILTIDTYYVYKSLLI